MNYAAMRETAREALRRSADLGFDRLAIQAAEKTLYAVRLAHGTVCRENVWKKAYEFTVTADWQRRQSAFTCPAEGLPALVDRIRALRLEIASQSEDREYILADVPRGRFAWEITGQAVGEVYSPEILYPAIERNVARARARDLRVTGYVEAMETRAMTLMSHGFELETRDHGITIGITVDDPATGASGVGRRASVFATEGELDSLLSDAVDEAMTLCVDGKDPGELAPGDYPVILSPSAVLDILSISTAYGMYDRRKVDEGRTYLSKHARELSFPEGLSFAHRSTIPVDGPTGRYSDMPFNHDMVPCGDIELIRDGRIGDLYTSSYWARETGARQTFQPYYAPPLVLEAEEGSALHGRHENLNSLIRDTEHGVFVADTWYIRMVAEMEGTLTGMTRDGIFEIRDGRLHRPLRHMRWHENPFRILTALDGLTEERILLGRSRLSGRSRGLMGLMPAIRVQDFHFSSGTKF